MGCSNSKSIKVAKTTTREKEEKGKIFISYAHSDKDIVHRVATKIEENNPIWIDKDKINVGDAFNNEIEKAIQQSSLVLCFISKEYASAYDRLEFFYAQSIKKKCFYVLLEKMTSDELNGMAVYIYGESIRLDGFKLFKQNQDEYANEIYSKLVNAFVNELHAFDVLKEENISSTRDYCFTGREDIFKLIDNPNNKKIIVLHGLPGVGSSSIAKEYCYRRRDENMFDEIYWINADSEYKINDGLYNYGTKLREHESEDGRLETIQQFFESVRELNKVLLIFDNVEDLKHITDTVDINQAKCKVIITTQSEKVISNYATRIDVKPFGLNEIKEYMKQKISACDQEQFNTLIEKLHVNKESLPYNLSMIRTDEPSTDVDELLRSNSNKSNTFLMRIINILVKKKQTQAVELLKYLAILDPDNVPGKLIEKILSGHNYKEAMQALIDQNLCQIVAPNTPHYGLRVHRLLQKYLEDYFVSRDGEIISKEMADHLMNVLCKLFPVVTKNPDEAWITGGLYYPHAIKILSKIEFEQKKTHLADLFEKVSMYNGYVLLNYDAAVDYAQKALDCLNKKDINETNSRLNSKIGLFYSKLGNTDKALEHFTISYDMCQQKFKEEDHPSVVKFYTDMGFAFSFYGSTTKAIECYTIALKVLQRLFKGDHPDIASAYNAIGAEYSTKGDPEESIENHRLALEMRQRLFNADHADVAASYFNIGSEYSKLGNTEKSIEYYTMALKMSQRLYKGDNANIATVYSNIGIEYSTKGETEKAIELYTIALEMRQRLFKGDHSDLASSYSNIGAGYSAKGQTEKAIEYYTIALEMRQRLFKEDHADLATSYYNIGMEYSSLGNIEKAIEFLTLDLEMTKRLLKGDNPKIASSYNNIGMVYSSFENREKAIEYLTMAIEMRQRLYKGDHRELSASYSNIGMQYSHLGNSEKAIEYLTIALEMLQRLLQPDHTHIPKLYNYIGIEYSRLGNKEKAIEYLTIALEMFRKDYSDDDPLVKDIIDTISNLTS